MLRDMNFHEIEEAMEDVHAVERRVQGLADRKNAPTNRVVSWRSRLLAKDWMMPSIQKIRTCLWFDKEAEEAANFYVSLFDNSRVLGLSRYGKGMPLPEGTVMTIDFELSGTKFMGLNGGPVFKFTEASSMIAECHSQAEIDRLWTALLADGGSEQQCGWLKDRYGLSCRSFLRDLAS